MTVYFLVIRKEQKYMETLYTKLQKIKQNQKETKEVEKLIQQNVNKKDIKPILINGLKNEINTSILVENTNTELYIKKDYDNPFNTYKHYIFKISENEKNIVHMDIQPSVIKRHLDIKLHQFDQNKITSEQIIHYLNLTIGVK